MFATIAATFDKSICRLYNANQFSHLYPLTTTVTKIKNDTVTVEDSNGNIWSFDGAEDWEVGDGCALIMHDNSTREIVDDVIISTRYQQNDWSLPYMYSNLEITDWNTDGREIAFMLSDGTELYATKSENIYNK
jgi:hypothetical protein